MSATGKRVNRLNMDDVLKAAAWLQSHRTSMEGGSVAPSIAVADLTAHLGRPITLTQILKMCRSLGIAWDGGRKAKMRSTKGTAIIARALLCLLDSKPIPEGLLEKLKAVARHEKIPEVGPLFEGGSPN